jgi:hypothetical protein
MTWHAFSIGVLHTQQQPPSIEFIEFLTGDEKPVMLLDVAVLATVLVELLASFLRRRLLDEPDVGEGIGGAKMAFGGGSMDEWVDKAMLNLRQSYSVSSTPHVHSEPEQRVSNT